MHAEVHSRFVCFRASPDLLHSAKARAEQRGVSVSELVRSTLREAVLETEGARP